jgi:hypothetical protein
VEQVLVSDIMVEFPELQSKENKQVREQIVASEVLNINYQIRYFKRNCKPIVLHSKLLEKEQKKLSTLRCN